MDAKKSLGALASTLISAQLALSLLPAPALAEARSTAANNNATAASGGSSDTATASQGASDRADEAASTFLLGPQSACDYFLRGTIPTYTRHAPISDDDPNKDKVADDALINYQYGYAFSDVNGYYAYNSATDTWEGTAPTMDTGVLIGGNTRSKHDAQQLDDDPVDFCAILPYASLYVDTTKLTYDEGTIEYEFFTDDFTYNNSTGKVPQNITLKGNERLTAYKEKFPAFDYPRKRDAEDPVDWQGIIYTGGIEKTRANGSGGYTTTVVRNAKDKNKPLFSVRYKDAVTDRTGSTYDLVLSFTQLTFVAEARVTGPVGILEASNLYVAPILCDDAGNYLVTMDDASNQVNVHDTDGVRVGTRFEFDYRIEDDKGNEPEGLLLYSMNDMDNASMATALQTDADWGKNALGNDFAWAEGFGVRSGAASFALLPYFNHQMRDVYDKPINNGNGDTALLRISRMPGSVPDGTANGLYFTTSVTAISGTGARNDANTLDTGVVMLLGPHGSMQATISSGRRGDVNIAFFDNSAANSIVQTASAGGKVYSLDQSFAQRGAQVENYDYLKVVGSGATSTHRMQADPGHHVYSVTIDGREVVFGDLRWEEQPDGNSVATCSVVDEYGRAGSRTEYALVRDPDEVVTISFQGVQDDHSIHVEFVPNGFFGMFRSISSRTLIALFLVAGFLLLLLVATIAWMTHGRDKHRMPEA